MTPFHVFAVLRSAVNGSGLEQLCGVEQHTVVMWSSTFVSISGRFASAQHPRIDAQRKAQYRESAMTAVAFLSGILASASVDLFDITAMCSISSMQATAKASYMSLSNQQVPARRLFNNRSSQARSCSSRPSFQTYLAGL